jgi:hypothetical protein
VLRGGDARPSVRFIIHRNCDIAHVITVSHSLVDACALCSDSAELRRPGSLAGDSIRIEDQLDERAAVAVINVK